MSQAITEAMKPCPFCGGEPHLMHCGAGTYMIQCLACKATTDDGSQERITANWNRRSAISAAQAQPVTIKPLNWQHDGNASYAYCPVTDVRWAARNQAERAHAEATREARIRSALVPPAVPGEVEPHTDDIAVDRFAAAMKAKLAEKRAQGYHGWDDPEDCTIEHLSNLLVKHVGKGDPLDVGNFAMMIHQRGGRIE